jgi:pimeloyl-ACP methyl ester carboxylesterase
VIHGARDKMVATSGGRATAKAIPGARLEIIDGMGHDLPRPKWPRLIDLISGHATAADAAAGREAEPAIASSAS